MKEQNKETEKQCDIHVVSNLLPCPFCGGDVVEKKVQWNISQALCTDCNEVWGTCGSKYEGRFDKWNVREKQLAANEGKICTPSMQEILDEAQRRKAKHSVQYADYSLETWTVASDLLEHRKNALLNDSSVRKVRIEYEM